MFHTATYVDGSQTECLAGTITLANEEECKLAASQRGGTYEREENNPTRPIGCIRWTLYNNFYWNVHATGGSDGNIVPICKRGMNQYITLNVIPSQAISTNLYR